MWYEILPIFGIIGACMAFPQAFIYYSNKFACNDHPHRRNIFMPRMLGAYLRDERVAGGDPYIVKGLDALSDAAAKPAKQ